MSYLSENSTSYSFPGAEITQPLRNVAVSETKTAMFECQVARDGVQGRWFKDGRDIAKLNSARYRSQQEGCIHRLCITDTALEDAGAFAFQFGSISTTAKLTVSGNVITT